MKLHQLTAFEAVARHRNFARAAGELAVTPTAMSKTIKQLEAALGVRLFNRTTRSVAVTESGVQLLAALAPALAQIDGAVTRARASAGRPSGQLRLNTSYVAYAALIEPKLPALLARYPELDVDVQIDNGLSDIVDGGFDAGIRLGHALQRDMIAVPVGPPQELVVVAAPRYLAARGEPRTPKELLAHDCIRQRLGPGRFLAWELGSDTVDVHGRLVVSEMHAALSAARAGCGLAYVFRQFAGDDLAHDRLRVVLARHARPRAAFHLYYPSRAYRPGKLDALLEVLTASTSRRPGRSRRSTGSTR